MKNIVRLCLVGVLTTAVHAASLDELAKDSPFLPKDREAAPVAPTENAVVEFRGLINTQQGNSFLLFDRTKNTSTWVRQGETGSDYVVQSYDTAAERLSVVYQGQKLTLALASAKVGLAAPSPIPPMASIPGQPPQPGQPNLNPGQPITPIENAARLAAVAAEVRRRRALRQGLPQPQPQPVPVQPQPALNEAPAVPNPPLPEGLPPGLPTSWSPTLPSAPRALRTLPAALPAPKPLLAPVSSITVTTNSMVVVLASSASHSRSADRAWPVL